LKKFNGSLIWHHDNILFLLLVVLLWVVRNLILKQNSTVIPAELFFSVDFCDQRAVHQQLFLHQFYRRVKVVSSKVVAGVNSGNSWALFVVLAFVSESCVFEGSAFL
jgi:hypothetical protein